MSKPLTESILEQLTGEALASFLSQAPDFEAGMRPGCSYALSNEPVADLNCLVAGKGAKADDRFQRAAESLLKRKLPFLGILFPEAIAEVAEQAAELGLTHAVDFPIMVREDEPIEPTGAEDVAVLRGSGAQAGLDSAAVMSSAFQMPEESARRVQPASFFESPALDVFLATHEGRCVGTVTVTHHGDTSGIWAMGTETGAQRRGIGRRLLSSALCETRGQGARRFFLGATPAGYKLYENLGFVTRVTTQVWVSGETHQA